MAKVKQSATRGAWRDQVAFQHLASEYEIPDEIMDKGLSAVIEWVNKSAGAVALVGAGALLLTAFAEAANRSEKRGIRDSVILETLDKRVLFFTWQFGKTYIGNTVNDALSLTATNGMKQEVPTRLIDSVVSVSPREREFILKYLDGSYLQGRLETTVLFEAREGIVFTTPTVIKVDPAALKSIECQASFSNDDDASEPDDSLMLKS